MTTAIAIILKGPLTPPAEVLPFPPLEGKDAAEMAIAMAGDVLANTMTGDRRQVVCHVGAPHPSLEGLGTNLALLPQRGQRPEERLANLQRELFESPHEHERVVMAWASAPSLEPRLVDMAVQRLDEVDVVVGPARRGGFTLLASRLPTPDLFEHAEEQAPSALADTVAQARGASLRIRLTAPRHSLDSVTDYEDALLRGELGHAARTVAAIERLLPSAQG